MSMTVTHIRNLVAPLSPVSKTTASPIVFPEGSHPAASSIASKVPQSCCAKESQIPFSPQATIRSVAFSTSTPLVVQPLKIEPFLPYPHKNDPA